MRFRKDLLLYYQYKIAFGFTILLCFILTPVIGITMLFCAIPFVILLLIPGLYNEYITIDANGISCAQSGKEIWSYDWNSIAMLKKSNRYHLPSVEILLYDKEGQIEPYGATERYFQLSKQAKKALEQHQILITRQGTVLCLDGVSLAPSDEGAGTAGD